MKILPSLASANQMYLGESIRLLEGHPYLHIDIEDGNFVPNISFGMKTIRAAAQLCSAKMDVHLMVTNPENYLDDLAEIGVAAIAFHWESTGYPIRMINLIHKFGMQAGIALNPCTPYSVILPYLDKIEYVLLMSSEPDEESESFQNLTLDKIRGLSQAAQGRIDIIVDGGIGKDEYDWVKQAGATGVVMGRTIFQAENSLSIIKEFR